MPAEARLALRRTAGILTARRGRNSTQLRLVLDGGSLPAFLEARKEAPVGSLLHEPVRKREPAAGHRGRIAVNIAKLPSRTAGAVI